MFEVLNYLDPLWYYNLRYTANPKFFVDYENSSSDEKSIVNLDPAYKVLSKEDAFFQLMKRGAIPVFPSEAKTPLPAPAEDLYLFTSKYFHKGWLIYFWLIRIFNGYKFIKETTAFFQCLRRKKDDLYEKTFSYPVSETIIPDNYKVSVILPTLNRYEHLKNFLEDLSSQSLPPKEIIIIDQSEDFNISFYDQFKHLPLHIIFQKEKGQWSARNKAIQNSKNEFLLFADDDSRVSYDWVENHLKCLSYFNSDISTGISIDKETKKGKDKTIFHLADEFDSGNALVRKEVFKKIGLFDQAFDGYRMGDTEFGLRAFLSGLKSISNPISGRIHVKTKKGGMRFWGSEKAFKPVSFFGSRPDPGTLYLFYNYYDKKYLFTFLLPRIFISFIPRPFSKKTIGWLTGFMLFLLFSPFWGCKLILNLKKIRRIKPLIPSLS